MTGPGGGQSRVALATGMWLITWCEREVTAHQAARGPAQTPGAPAQAQPDLVRPDGEADASYFGGRRTGTRGRSAAGKIPGWGILERRGRGAGTVVPNGTPTTWLQETVKRGKRGTLV